MTTNPPTSPLGFDAFFSEITESKEFKDLKNSGTDISSLADLERSLTDMQSGAEKAANMMKDFDTKFTPLSSSPTNGADTTAHPNDVISKALNEPISRRQSIVVIHMPTDDRPPEQQHSEQSQGGATKTLPALGSSLPSLLDVRTASFGESGIRVASAKGATASTPPPRFWKVNRDEVTVDGPFSSHFLPRPASRSPMLPPARVVTPSQQLAELRRRPQPYTAPTNVPVVVPNTKDIDCAKKLFVERLVPRSLLSEPVGGIPDSKRAKSLRVITQNRLLRSLVAEKWDSLHQPSGTL